MTNLLDMRTIIFSYAVSNAICAAVMALLWFQNRRRFEGLGFWLADFTMQFAAMILISLRGTVSDIVSTVGANALVVLGTILLYAGLQRFTGRRGAQAHNAILLVVFILVHTYFTLAQPNLAARNVNLSLSLLAICLQCTWLMLYGADAAIRPLTRGVGVVFAAFCLVSAVRAVVDLVAPPENDFFHSNAFETLLLLTYQMLFVILTFALLLMLNRHLFADLERDIAARQQTEKIVRLRLRLLEFAADHLLEELMQRALDEIGQITGSPIGFYHFVEADQETLSLQAWSTRTLQEFCQAEGKGMHYSLDQAGVWVDCVHQRRPVIHNDYASLPHRKGMPPGHALVKRELVVPTMRKGHIVSVLGVGNKPTDYDEQDVELVAYVADIIWTIVERKQAEEQLQDYQHQLETQNLELRKLSLAIEQSGSTIVITDPDGAIQYANPPFEETTGYSVQEALGQNPRILKSGEQSADDYQALWETITSGQTWRGEFHNRRKDGTLYWESATIAPVHNAAGQITNYIAVKEDITKQKQAQEAIRQYAERLAAQNAELDAFAHTVAHDLKNPLGIISGFSQVLAVELANTPNTAARESANTIVKTCFKMNIIIDELLLLSSVRQIDQVELSPLDMAAIVNEAQGGLTTRIAERQVEMILPPTWPTALGYRPWVEQVWINYLDNAIKYGGRPPRMELGAERQTDGMVRFWVRDNGVGLSEQDRARLFTPFERLSQVRVKGHGLGLSIVRRIVEKLGGEVGVESAPGQGSKFYFTLPPAEDSNIKVQRIDSAQNPV